jgi:hypothetical protein
MRLNMRSLRPQILLLLAAALASASSAAPAGGLRVALLADAEVQGDTILLADLLPANTPAPLRSAAAAISLGTAPQNGSARNLRRDAIVAALRSTAVSPASVAIPDVVTVRRDSRPVVPEEIFPAIQNALAKSHIAGTSKLRPEDLTMDSSVELPAGTQFEVTQIAFDRAIGRARFRLKPRSVSGANPFYVTARLALTSLPLPPRSTDVAHLTHLASAKIDASSVIDSPVLVDPRQSAHLHLRSASADMLLVVKPLQRGSLGQTVRVRLVSSAKTLQARVAGKDFLEAVF